jgi:endonuclease/exonuclease/phosphatase family metal-dependent hydrolase
MSGRSVTVVTRNVYLGADLEPLVAALLAGGEDADRSLVAAAAAVRAEVERTDFRVRARLLAHELVTAGADLVGLQEVARWRFADEPELDFLAELAGALRDLGAAYDVGVVGSRAQVALPTAEGDVALLVRDAVLVRQGVQVSDSVDLAFARDLELQVGGEPLRLARGFQWVDLEVGDSRARFVNTHLEFYDPAVSLAQAGELVASLPDDRAVVVVGDVNAEPGSPTYARLTEALDDLWLEGAPGDAGLTCGPTTTLREETPFFTQRVDVVLGRPAPGSRIEVDDVWLVGASRSDRDPGAGLWPSDHAGVVVRLHI